MTDPNARVPLMVLPQHLDYVVNLLGTANLRYVDTAPILQDWQRQVAEHAAASAPQVKPNGAADTAPGVMQ